MTVTKTGDPRMSVAASQRVLLRRTMRGLWPHLPLLTAGSVVVCIAAAVAALVAPGATPVSVPVLAVLVAPGMTAIAGVANSVLQQDDSPFSSWARGFAVGVRRGIPAVIPLALSGALLLVAIEVWRRADQPVLLASVAVSGAVTLALIPLTAALVQTAIALPKMPIREQWRTAALLVLRWPVRFIAAPVLLGFGVWLAIGFSAGLLLLVPAPVALVSAAAFWTSAVEADLLTVDNLTENDL